MSYHLRFAGLLVGSVLLGAMPVMAQEQPARILTLEQAVNQAIEKSPVLAAATSRTEAAYAASAQAGVLPNPDLSIEVENVFGDGPYDGTDAAEITYGVSQLIEMPGKRSSRVQVADAEKKRAHYMRDGNRLDLIRDVSVAYAEAVAAEEQLKILNDERDLTAAVRDSVAAKVEAGKVPPIQKNKAEIELSTSDIALDRALRLVLAKKTALSVLIGSDVKDMEIRADSMPELSEPDSLENYKTSLAQSPDLQMMEAGIEQARSQVSLEKANAIPDPTFGIGIRQSREDDTQAMVAGISFPFPVFNQNRAGIARAGHEVTASTLDRQSGQLSIEAQLVDAYEDLVTGYRTAKALETTVIPGAEEAFEVARIGYDAGKFEYLEVLDAQRTLFETRKERNAAVLDYYRQRAFIERLTARHFKAPISSKKEQ